MSDWHLTRVLTWVLLKTKKALVWFFLTDRGLAYLGLFTGLFGIIFAFYSEVKADRRVGQDYENKKTEFKNVLWPMNLILGKDEFETTPETERMKIYDKIIDKFVTQIGNPILEKNDRCRTYFNVFYEHLVFVTLSTKSFGNNQKLDNFSNFYQKKEEMLNSCEHLQ